MRLINEIKPNFPTVMMMIIKDVSSLGTKQIFGTVVSFRVSRKMK